MEHRYLRPLIGVQLYLTRYIPKGYNLLLSAETAIAVLFTSRQKCVATFLPG